MSLQQLDQNHLDITLKSIDKIILDAKTNNINTEMLVNQNFNETLFVNRCNSEDNRTYTIQKPQIEKHKTITPKPQPQPMPIPIMKSESEQQQPIMKQQLNPSQKQQILKIKFQKLTIMQDIKDLINRGAILIEEQNQKVNMESDLETLEFIKQQLTNQITKYTKRDGLYSIVSGGLKLLQAANQYSPYKLNLDGFPEHFIKELKNDPELVDELVNKYTGKITNMSCEMKLLWLLSTSTLQYHIGMKNNNIDKQVQDQQLKEQQLEKQYQEGQVKNFELLTQLQKDQ